MRLAVPVLAAALLVLPAASAPGGPADNPRSNPRTLFGACIQPTDGQSYIEARTEADSQFGGMDVIRYFDRNLPDPWSSIQQRTGADRPLVVSFKASPEEILSGEHDEALRTWFANAPETRRTWWSYFPEPEDNIEDGQFTASQFREAWRHIDDLAAGGPKGLRSTLVLMTYTLADGSQRNWRDYYPGDEYVDVMGWDGYNWSHRRGVYADPASLYGRAVTVSNSLGKPWGLAELGSVLVDSDNGARRAAWLEDVGQYATEHHARFVTYFNADVGVDYRLHDAASQQAWRNVVNSTT